ncbi:MAG TPA: MEDS domain-containing protein [bacterium]|nr:MEDS domain-containing protein [bacterium]
MSTSPRVLKPELGEPQPGDHTLFVYEDAVDLTAWVVLFIQHGLDRNEQILYVADDLQLSQVAEALAAGGVDVNREVKRGAVIFVNAEEYCALPRFDASHMVDLIRTRVREAGACRFAGLMVAAEMTWALKIGIPDIALVEYEGLLDDAFRSLGPLTVACMYRRGRFTPVVLKQLLHSHGTVVAGDHVHVSLNPWFQHLAETDRHALLQSAGERRITPGGFFFKQGDEARELFILTSGRVKLVRTDPDGRNIIHHLVAPTELFGERAALASTPRLTSAQAVQGSRALVWDVQTILEAMMRHPAIGLNAVLLMAERVERHLTRFQDLSLLRVELRFARLLRQLAQTMGRPTLRGVVLDVPLTGQELAEMASTTPYTVSRLLAAWRRLDIVDAQHDRILILQPQRLAAIAEEPDSADVAAPAEGGSPPV